MRTVVIVLLVLIGIAGVAVAGPAHKVGLFADPGQVSCVVPGDGAGLVQVHMFHVGEAPSTAVQFAIYPPACWSGATYLGDVLSSEAFLHIGASNGPIGLSVAYGECRSLPSYLGYVQYAGVTASECCEVHVSKPTDVCEGCWVGTAAAIAVDCDFNMHEASTSESVTLNADATCPCQTALATQTSTWGRVKSLYR
jgi:hypothetical protein